MTILPLETPVSDILETITSGLSNALGKYTRGDANIFKA